MSYFDICLVLLMSCGAIMLLNLRSRCIFLRKNRMGGCVWTAVVT
jgi:hypothetical protein